jgi:hypothetical protein
MSTDWSCQELCKTCNGIIFLPLDTSSFVAAIIISLYLSLFIVILLLFLQTIELINLRKNGNNM